MGIAENSLRAEEFIELNTSPKSLDELVSIIQEEKTAWWGICEWFKPFDKSFSSENIVEIFSYFDFEEYLPTSISPEQKVFNIERVNAYQVSVLKKREGVSQYIHQVERAPQKRFLAFYIRSMNLICAGNNDYRKLIEIFFLFAEKYYIPRSHVFTDLKIIPREIFFGEPIEEYSNWVDKKHVKNVQGYDFEKEMICNTNPIHFSHGKSKEALCGARPLICKEIQEDRMKQKNNVYSLLSFNKDTEFIFSEVLKTFFEDLQNFENNILRDAGIDVADRETDQVVNMVKKKTK